MPLPRTTENPVDAPPHKRYWRLYYLLDLLPPVTAKQVKWNFRKVTLRHHYYQAYLVLYNRSRKYFYDAVGEDAYGFITSGTWGPLVPMLGIVGTTLFYTLVMICELAMLILFFSFLGARVDNVMEWGWERVVAPLMAFVCIAWLVSTFALVVSFVSPRTYREGMSVMDRLSPVGNFLAASAYFSLPIVIGHGIRHNSHARDGDYVKYMCMPIMGDIFYYLTSLIWRWPARLRQQMEIGENQPSELLCWGIFIMGPLNMGCGIAQWVLIGRKLDYRMHRSWYVVFVPFCIRGGLRVVEAFLRSMMKYTQGVRSQIGVAFDTLGSFFSNGILVVSLYFVAVRIERGYHKCHMAHALIPVYITLGYLFICMILTMIYLLVRNGDKAEQERRINSAWVPPQDETPVFGASGTARPIAPADTSSGSGPIPGEVHKDRDWDDFDGITSQSSAAFPSEMRNAEDEPLMEDEDYDDFNSDDEEQVFPRDDHSPRESQEPYGSPRDDEDVDADEEQYTPMDSSRVADSLHEPLAATQHPYATRQAPEVPVRAAQDVPTRAGGADDVYSERSPMRDPRTEPAGGEVAGVRVQPPPPKREPRPRRREPSSRHDESTLTGSSGEYGESDYTYVEETEENEEGSYTEQTSYYTASDRGSGEDEGSYEYTEYTEETEEKSQLVTPSASSAYSSSFASSRRH